MSQYQLVVARQIFEPVAHPIIAHSLEVEADEIGEEEGVARAVPGAISYCHGVGAVLGAARR